MPQSSAYPSKRITCLHAHKQRQKTEQTCSLLLPSSIRALKGSSISNCDLHFMVNKPRNEFKKRNIHVLCEAYDGQWHNHIALGSNGQHLTKMHGKITWQCISKLSKDKCLEQLSVHSIIKNTEKNAIQQLVRGFNKFAQDNVHVQQNNCGAISIMTISKKMSEIVSVTEKSWPDLFHEGISMFAGNTNTSNTNNRNRVKKKLGTSGKWTRHFVINKQWHK